MLTRHTQKQLTWVDLVSPTPTEVRELMQEFDLHPLVAQELLVPSYKSKVERHGDAVYAIFHFPLVRGHQRPEQEIDFVIGKHFLITTRYETVDPLHSFAKTFDVDSVLGRGTATHGGHLFVIMIRNLYEALIDECSYVVRRLQDIEEHIFNGDERQMVVEISQTGRVIHDFKQALSAHQEMLASFDAVGARFFGPEFTYYVRDLQAVFNRLVRALESTRESLVELRETNNSLLSTKQNETMRVFTVLAFIFLPLSFIAGVFGMNTEHTPIVGVQGDFWILLGGMVAAAIGCFAYFRYKGWL